MNELCLARLVGRKGTEDEGTIRNRDEKELDGDGEGREGGGKVGERSKGYLHRVVFFSVLFVRTVCRTAQPADLRDDEHELHSI